MKRTMDPYFSDHENPLFSDNENPLFSQSLVDFEGQHILSLIHARNCKNDLVFSTPCRYPHCQTMVAVLNHLETCSDSQTCNVLHCASTRWLLAHWKECGKSSLRYVCTTLWRNEKELYGIVKRERGGIEFFGWTTWPFLIFQWIEIRQCSTLPQLHFSLPF